MKKHTKLNIKIRDLERLKDVTAARHARRLRARVFAQRRDEIGEFGGGWTPFGPREAP